MLLIKWTLLYKVKLEIDQSFFETESGNENICKQADRQTNTQNGLNFENSVAIIVVYLFVNFEIDR